MPHIISGNHQRAWRSFLVSHSWVTKEIDSRLKASQRITLDVYELLYTLELAGDRRLRMSELAEMILFSRSGLTRMVDRLEEQGYVRREPSPDDRRGWYAVITEDGLAVRSRCCDVVQTTLKEFWESALTDDEALQMIDMMSRVAKKVHADRVPIG
jgi:DNA-binding MarR family transcriptional regulator